uniref:Uncharacterized protein n=1 Tax=Tanacetum cinerariifolium TaxID=118510 RepID=A0A699I349_TANCI|nr:hypothetical protein [Tanacetum cinerariifolium]
MRRVCKGFSGVDTLLFDGMLVPQQEHDDVVDDITDDVVANVADADADAEPTPPSPTPATTSPPQPVLIPLPSQVESTPPPSPRHSPISPPSSPPPQQPPSHDAAISIDLLNKLLETCETLTKKVGDLEQDEIAQAIEITKFKKRVRKLEKKRKLKAFGLKRLRKVETTQRVKSSAGTVMDDQDDASKYREIAEIDAYKDVTLEEVAAEVAKDAIIKGRLEESQAHVYHLDLEHANKVLSVHDDEAKPAKLKEVIEVVTTAKLMTEVVTAATTAAPMLTASASRRRKGVVIRDPEETATSLVIVHFELKSKDKGKGILVPEPKPLKKQAQIEQDEAYSRELEAELNVNINWNEVIKQVKRNEKQDNAVMRYQSLNRKPQTEAQARKNLMCISKTWLDLKWTSSKASKVIKRKSVTYEEKAAKNQKLNEEVEELKTHLQIVPNNEDDVYTKATPLALKVLVVDYQIHTKHNKPYYKIINADGTYQLFLSFITLLRNFDREDPEMLWQIVQERFASSEPKNFSDDFLLNALKMMFEKPNVKDNVWKNQRDFKEYTSRDYYCWLKTYCYWYKLKLLDNAAHSKLRLLEVSVAADEKMKKLL